MKIGTIGTGFIVYDVQKAILDTPGIVCGAVYSRKMETGEKLAKQFGVNKVYTDLDEMLKDSELDTIYIASPNSLHFEEARRSLEHGKNVILEKPFTPTLIEAEELFKKAEEKDLFLLEAIVTQSLPNFKVVKKLLPRVGRVRMVMCSYSQYSSRYDLFLSGKTPNVFNPAFAGGALMDLNMYNISFMASLFGKPKEIHYFPNRHQNGVDTSGILILKYPDFVAVNEAAKDTWGVNSAQIQGEKGFIYIKDGTNHISQVSIETRDGKKQSYNDQRNDFHYHYEIQELKDIIEKRDYQALNERKKLTLDTVDILEKAGK